MHVGTGKGYGSDVRIALENKDLAGGVGFLLHPRTMPARWVRRACHFPSPSQTLSAPGTETCHECRRESRRGTFPGKV